MEESVDLTGTTADRLVRILERIAVALEAGAGSTFSQSSGDGSILTMASKEGRHESSCPQLSHNPNRAAPTVELGRDTLSLLAGVQADLQRLADHLAPQPPDIVGTPFLANRLGCTPTWIAQMVRNREIPQSCIVPGSGKGRQWKFYRKRIEDWLASR